LGALRQSSDITKLEALIGGNLVKLLETGMKRPAVGKERQESLRKATLQGPRG
jgi:hypothetical protein